MDKIAALPSVAYSGRAALMFAVPVTAGGRATSATSQVITLALIHSPPQERAIIVAGRRAVSSRASEVMINEAAARILKARVGSVIHLRGYRPDQAQQVLNGAVLPPGVVLPAVRVAGIIRTPADLAENPDAPTDVTFTGNRRHLSRRPPFTTGSPPPSATDQDSDSISSAARQASRPSKPR